GTRCLHRAHPKSLSGRSAGLLRIPGSDGVSAPRAACRILGRGGCVMSAATLLVELLTEELPPKALPHLGEAFAGKIVEGLESRGLIEGAADFRSFAAPRRLAVSVAGVRAQAPSRQVSEKI